MADAIITAPSIWFSSGTVQNVGQECDYRRFLEYHAGRHLTGYRRRATAVPLATGKAVHQGLELIGNWILDWQAQKGPSARLLSVPDEVTAWAATEAATTYARLARSRGLELTKGDSDAAAAYDTLIREQATLTEALIWIYALGRLPFMLSQGRLLAVEQEETPVLNCSCGLGDWFGAVDQHLARGCGGYCAQGRADFLWDMLEGNYAGQIVYEEIKTKSVANYGSEQAWEHSGQLLLNMEAASRRIGREVGQAFVPTLYKGRRAKEYSRKDDPTAPKVQESVLVYGWFDPGNGMNRDPEWAARYKWYDDLGGGHTLPKTFKKAPIWDPAIPLPATNATGVTVRAGASRVEQWVRGWILPSQYPDFLKVLGPYPKPSSRVPDAVDAILAEETRWRNDVEYLRASGIFEPGDVASTEDGQRITASTIIPRTWKCTGFDGTPCMFKRICFKDPEWENLAATGAFEIRKPHHAPEAVAYEQAGVVFPPDDEDEGETE